VEYTFVCIHLYASVMQQVKLSAVSRCVMRRLPTAIFTPRGLHLCLLPLPRVTRLYCQRAERLQVLYSPIQSYTILYSPIQSLTLNIDLIIKI